MDETPLERLRRFGKLGTIDLRVDYLRPALGERFTLSAEVLRLGSRVATTADGIRRRRRQAARHRQLGLHRLLTPRHCAHAHGCLHEPASLRHGAKVSSSRSVCRRRHVEEAEHAVIEVVVAVRRVEQPTDARRVEAAPRRQVGAEPGDEGNARLRFRRERVRQPVQEDAELAERLAVVAQYTSAAAQSPERPFNQAIVSARKRSVATIVLSYALTSCCGSHWPSVVFVHSGRKRFSAGAERL